MLQCKKKTRRFVMIILSIRKIFKNDFNIRRIEFVTIRRYSFDNVKRFKKKL